MASSDFRGIRGLGTAGWAGAALGLVALGGVYYFLATVGPRRVQGPAAPAAGMEAAQWRREHEIGELERGYRQLPPGQTPSPELVQQLQRAVELQEGLMRGSPRADVDQSRQLLRLQRERDTLIAQRDWPRVEALERRLQESPPAPDRIKALGELLGLRRSINRSAAAASYKDVARELAAERELAELQAEPLHAVVETAKAEATAAEARQDWAAALDGYKQALNSLAELDQKYPGTRHSDMAGEARLRQQVAALGGADEFAEIAVYLAGAKAAESAGRLAEAAQNYQQAMNRQTLINRTWPDSRFATTAPLDQWEQQRQTDLAGVLVGRMRELDQQAAPLLAARRTLAAEAPIGQAAVLARQLRTEYPRSNFPGDDLARKFLWLDTLRGSLRALQDNVYDQLLPVPGEPALLLGRTEVSQGLYAAIMKVNPSRQADPRRPVNSVTWEEARDFCARLGWLLGQTVRLPTGAELQAAGDASHSAGGTSVNANGFDGLTGGLAEWLHADAGGKLAPVAAGGRPVAGFAPGPAGFGALDPATRSPGLGFRVVVLTETRD